MPKETLNPYSNNTSEARDTTIGVESDFRVEKEDKIPYEDDRNFVDSATFMACQGEGEKMHSASPDKE